MAEKFVFLQSNRGAPDPIGLNNTSDVQINPATEDTLNTIAGYLDTVETKLQSLIDKNQAQETGGNLALIKTDLDNIYNQLNITLSSLRDALRGANTKDFSTLQTTTDNIYARLDITLSSLRDAITGVSPNNKTLKDINDTLLLIKAKTDNLDVALSTRLADATYTGRVGEVQATPTQYTLLGRLKDLWDKLNDLFTNGNGKIKLWDGTNQAGIDAANHQYVAGKSAVGIAPSSNPVSVAGIDAGGLKRGIATDTVGRTRTAIIQEVTASLSNNYYSPPAANLNAGATLTLIGESILGVAAIRVNFISDQPCILYIDQSIDNINWDLTDTWIRLASQASGRTFQAVASYFRMRITNSGSSATTYLRLQTVLCPVMEVLPRALSSAGRLLVDSVTGIDTTKKILELVVDRTDVISAGTMRQAGTRYTIPVGYLAQVTGVIAYASDAKSDLILAKLRILATYNSGTTTFTAGTPYSAPIFGSTLFVEVTTAMGATNDQIYTVGYTNQDGTAGRSATTTIKLPKSSGVGVIVVLTLQTGDYGVQSVQSVSTDKVNTGIVAIKGAIQFCDYSVDVANASRTVNTSDYWYAQAGEILGLDVGITKPGAGATAERQLSVILTLTSA